MPHFSTVSARFKIWSKLRSPSDGYQQCTKCKAIACRSGCAGKIICHVLWRILRQLCIYIYIIRISNNGSDINSECKNCAYLSTNVPCYIMPHAPFHCAQACWSCSLDLSLILTKVRFVTTKRRWVIRYLWCMVSRVIGQGSRWE